MGESTPWFNVIEVFCKEIGCIRGATTPRGMSLGELAVSLGLPFQLERVCNG